MKSRSFESRLVIPRSRAEVFEFFADAGNLERITPPWLSFRVLTPTPIAMSAGALIDYRLRVRGVPFSWRTRISAWEPPYRFVDEQLHGPYRRWVHEHVFVEEGGATMCLDRVEYAVPGGPLIDRLIVRPDVERIFAFRRDALVRILGSGTRPGGETASGGR